MPSLQFQSQVAEQADTASRQLVALSYSAISSNPKTVSVVSKLQFTHASRSSHSWLSKQPQLVQSFKLLVANLSCAELGTAQPQLVFVIICSLYSLQNCVHEVNFILGHPVVFDQTHIIDKELFPNFDKNVKQSENQYQA